MVADLHFQEKSPNAEAQSIEWVFWATHIIFPAIKTQDYSKFVKCVINQQQIWIENHPSIPISEIQACDFALMTRYRSIHTRLLLKDGRKIEIAVADPFYPNFKNRDNASQAWAFREIVNDLMIGKTPEQPLSPYDRAKHKAEFYPNDIVYDPHRSPIEYYDQYRKRWTASEICIKIITCGIIWLLGLFVILLIVNYLSG